MRQVGGQRWCSYLQGMHGDGAAPPAVQVTHGVHSRRAAEQHQPGEQVLLGNGEEELEDTGLWRQTGDKRTRGQGGTGK